MAEFYPIDVRYPIIGRSSATPKLTTSRCIKVTVPSPSLEQAEADPALRAWFAAEQAFDTKIASAFAGIKAPAGPRSSPTPIGVGVFNRKTNPD